MGGVESEPLLMTWSPPKSRLKALLDHFGEIAARTALASRPRSYCLAVTD
jgi:hypothetical protein